MGWHVHVQSVVAYVATCGEFRCEWTGTLTGDDRLAQEEADAHRNQHIEEYRKEQEELDG